MNGRYELYTIDGTAITLCDSTDDLEIATAWEKGSLTSSSYRWFEDTTVLNLDEINDYAPH